MGPAGERVRRGSWRLRRRLKKRGRGWRRRLCRRVVLASAQGATALRAEGCGIAPWAMNIKSALRIHLSVSYGMVGILVIIHLRWHFLERSKAGLFSPARRRLYGFRRQRRYKKWRRRRRTSPAQRYYIPPEGESPEPACKAKPITGRTLAAQGRMARRLAQPSRP